MRLLLRAALPVAAVAGGLWLGVGVADAESAEPDVTVCGNTIAGIDTTDCESTSDSGSTSTGRLTETPDTGGSDGVGSGNQINPDVNAPITVCGNSIAVLSDSSAECEPSGSDGPSGDNTTSGEGGALSGNQVNPVINAPITVCGNAIGVIGDSQAKCKPSGQGPSASAGNTTTGEDGFLSGNQVNPVVNLPITICGNVLTVLGDSAAKCLPTGQGIGSTGDNTTSGEDGALSGNQINPLANLPITICANAVSVLGEGEAKCKPSGQGVGQPGDNTTSGENGDGSGNQINPLVDSPITVCGNAADVLGDSVAICEPGGQGVGGPGDNTTDGDGGNGSGNQLNPPVDSPVTVCGNTGSVGGDSTAVCTGGGGTPPGPGNPPPGNPPGPGNPPPGNPPGVPPANPPAVPPAPGTPSGPPSAGEPGADQGLPVTGTDAGLMGLLGLLFTALGAAFVRLSRRKQSKVSAG